MKPLLNRLLPHLLWLSGIGILVLSMAIFGHHGVPYQDATPEQLAIQKAGLASLNRWALFGSLLLISGILWAASRSVRKRKAASD